MAKALPTLTLLVIGGLSLPLDPGAAQEPIPPDTTLRDTVAFQLPEVIVTVTRVPEKLSQVPAAVSVLGTTEIQQGQATIGIDEMLSGVPGVYVADRFNFSEGQRLSIRSFGSRAQFGIRGIKVFLDGIPQTLPDGQTQMTNIDLANVGRIEVLRGSSSALYGNASGGAVSFSSLPADTAPLGVWTRVEGGSYGLFKGQLRASFKQGVVSGTFSGSYFNWNGFRQQSAANGFNLYGAANYAVSGSTQLLFRAGYAAFPAAQNPGALTLPEYQANPDSAAPNNILRQAEKDTEQGLLGVGVQHVTSGGAEYGATIFGFTRDLKNPIAAPPPQGQGPNVGTYIDIGRLVFGARASGALNLGASKRAPRLSTGIDFQTMRDDRTNSRAVAGIPDTLILDQQERVTEVGPFVQVTWEPATRLLVSGGVRYDWVDFSVEDNFLNDGVDNSGTIDMSAPSGNLGLSLAWRPWLTPYVTVSSSFETPTTTELVNAPGSTGGFNTSLQPQKAMNYEVGARGKAGRYAEYSAAFFIGRIRDAIVPYREVSGRTYYQNAGQVNTEGLELGVSFQPITQLNLFASYTWSNYKFAEYLITNGTVTDTLNGNRLPGIPQDFIRFGFGLTPGRGFFFEASNLMSSSLYANDQNTFTVYGFGDHGAGDPVGVNNITNLRLGWNGHWNALPLSLYLGVDNLWDLQYVSAVTINGIGDRVLEPGPLRSVYLGLEVGWTNAR